MNKIKEAIDRLESLKEHCKSVQDIDECTKCEEYFTAIDTAVEVLENLPTVENEPLKHGTWELKYIANGHYWECSCCHTKPNIYITKDTNYCPNCGAKMDGEESV